MKQWARYGDFDAATLVALAQPEPRALSTDEGLLGLPLAEIVAYGTFRDGDNELYSFVRRQWPGADDNSGRIIVFSTRADGSSLQMERDGKFSASNSGATRQMVGD